MELLDIRDKNGRVTGQTAVRGTVLNPDSYFLAVHIYLYNDQGQFLIQKRSLQKQLYPGKWDITGGAASAGETSEEAACREVLEELGIKLRRSDLKYINRLDRHPWLIDIWACRQEISLPELSLQTGEVDDIKLVTASGLLSIIFGTEYRDDPYKKVMEDFFDKIHLTDNNG